MMATIFATKIPYPVMNCKNVAPEVRMSHGTMAKPTAAQMNCPRTILMYRGKSAEASAPNGMRLAETLVPSWPKAKENEQKNTAALVLGIGFSSSIAPRSRYGFQ